MTSGIGTALPLTLILSTNTKTWDGGPKLKEEEAVRTPRPIALSRPSART